MDTHTFDKDGLKMYAFVFQDNENIGVKERLENLYTESGIDYQTNTKRRNPNENLDENSVKEIFEKILESWNAVKEGPDDELFKPLGALIDRERVIIVHSTPGYPIYHPPSP